ncbi:serine hydrolase domain-containing protein [Photobacterium sanguinicancri]|uniref:serine hydrolase domain-containing protein n=1 Tax=Photobacterium sanguinicancri TaxID=875932 RepID=UPI0026E384E8|nr:serine hydrolase domain-containing protein [Photobacterium sanguinicancri]MDO6496926.1 serine hydrolase domain-containing protein [Photobacterium sanguinicancri]
MWADRLRRMLKNNSKNLGVVLPILLMPCLAFSATTFDKDKMDRYLESLAAHNKATLSVVLAEKGEVIYSKQTLLPNESVKFTDDEKLYKAGSITKTFTAVLVFQQIEQDKLTLTTPLSDFYPQIQNASKITIGQMLSHRSGIFNYTNDPAFNDYFTQYQDKKKMLEKIAAFSPTFEPDSSYEYSNSNYALLGYILEDVTGESYTQLVQDRIINKLGLTQTVYCAERNDCGRKQQSFYFDNNEWHLVTQWSMSVANSAGAVLSTPYDLARFMRALFKGELVSNHSLALMKGITNTTSKGLFKLPFYNKYSYGHRGLIEGFQSDMSYFESDDFVFAINTDALNYNFNDITIAILNIYNNRPFELPDFDRKPITLDANQLKKYQGNFLAPNTNLDIKVFVQGKSLMMQAMGQEPLAVESFSLHEFEYKPAGILCKFAKTVGGGVNYAKFTLYQGNWVLNYQKQ